MFGDHLAVRIGDQGAVGSASALPGFVGQHKGSPKQGKVGCLTVSGRFGASPGCAHKGNSGDPRQKPGTDQDRPSLQLLHGRAH